MKLHFAANTAAKIEKGTEMNGKDWKIFGTMWAVVIVTIMLLLIIAYFVVSKNHE